MSFSIARSLVLAGLTAAWAMPAAAQEDLSVEELKALFERQRAVFSEAQKSGLGATRGLKLITVDDVAAEEATTITAETATPEPSTDVGQTTAATDSAVLPLTTAETEPTAPPTTAGTAPTTLPETTTSAETTQDATKTTETVMTDAPVSDPVATDPAATETVVATAAVSDPNKPLVFGQLDPDLQVNLRIKFGFDSAALSAEETPKLEKMCQVLQQSDINLVRIVGHTDTSGSDAYNERLSVLRAKEVARHLIENCDIAPSRLETLGLGERFPFNTANPRADENRRVEFQALS